MRLNEKTIIDAPTVAESKNTALIADLIKKAFPEAHLIFRYETLGAPELQVSFMANYGQLISVRFTFRNGIRNEVLNEMDLTEAMSMTIQVIGNGVDSSTAFQSPPYKKTIYWGDVPLHNFELDSHFFVEMLRHYRSIGRVNELQYQQ